ncbi:MAG TPA: DUF4388 domain-containing protein [Thermomicrobiales bacterium]|nr:DUF4388 domain-containing protein [Thermomicrobiales bacterium]
MSNGRDMMPRGDFVPSSLGEGGYDLQGRLGAFSISDIFQMFTYTEKTGTLSMMQGWNTRTITFERGRISYVAAGSRLPSVIELLIRNGRVSREEIDKQARGMTDSAIVQELVSDQRISSGDLQRCQEQLLETSIYTLFLWRNCYFAFKAGEVVKEGGVAVSVDSTHLIIEGTRRVDEWIEISPVVPSVFMIFRRKARQPAARPSRALAEVFSRVDGRQDVVGIARATKGTQFDTARALYELVRAGYIEAIPPNREKVIELYNLAVESVYLKLVLFDFARAALEFENQLNRFAIDNKLKVRMSAGKILMSDTSTPITSTELVDLYRLFIGIQNNKFSKMFEPVVANGLIEGLYRHTDPDMQAMMRMYEFVEIEGLLLLDIFGDPVRNSDATANEPAS